jgi:hypothetical protein
MSPTIAVRVTPVFSLLCCTPSSLSSSSLVDAVWVGLSGGDCCVCEGRDNVEVGVVACCLSVGGLLYRVHILVCWSRMGRVFR